MNFCIKFQQFNQPDAIKVEVSSTIHDERTIFVKKLTICLEKYSFYG